MILNRSFTVRDRKQAGLLLAEKLIRCRNSKAEADQTVAFKILKDQLMPYLLSETMRPNVLIMDQNE
jgi:hypothetical protein